MNLRAPKSKETFAAYSHATALIFAIIGSIYLIVLARENIGLLIATIVYSFCLCFMFGASAFYHTVKREDFEESVWRKVDHVAIYFMIAGSYTAISYIYTDGNFRWIIIGLQWGFVVVGTILKILYIKVPIWIDVGIYLVMGWMIVIRLDYMFKAFPLRIFLLVLFGGIAYTVGAIFHALNKQKPFPGVFVFHDIFHVLIIVGASVHYSTILEAVL
ncbi:MAG: hemolysin III family protein [Candidatus Heimdallarchaeota archaeon]|nr:hemolysin III family protein [Candidatus Heimdallarchaeota archaeon]MCG3255067.1 hemolysin III family protein [Candidatus Heimdallarchaeota archaeon]MCK4610141.1 hemolysin III family protein [Candidatus Heimdallarchaeota archaeon]